MFGGRDPAVRLYGDSWIRANLGWSPVFRPINPSPRQAHAMASASGGAVMFGGILDGGGRSDETWEWSRAGWDLRPTSTSPSPRSAHGMAYDRGRGQTVIFGGDDGASLLNDTWERVSIGCHADCDRNALLDIFDFLCFQNSFVAGEPYACDCDPDPHCSIFDFLCFQSSFVWGCP